MILSTFHLSSVLTICLTKLNLTSSLSQTTTDPYTSFSVFQMADLKKVSSPKFPHAFSVPLILNVTTIIIITDGPKSLDVDFSVFLDTRTFLNTFF